jgi:hypothetical protein
MMLSRKALNVQAAKAKKGTAAKAAPKVRRR